LVQILIGTTHTNYNFQVSITTFTKMVMTTLPPSVWIQIIIMPEVCTVTSNPINHNLFNGYLPHASDPVPLCSDTVFWQIKASP